LPAAILLVAGPSGAGKSTFIQCLKVGHLPADLKHVLPVSAAQWRIIEGNDLLKRDITADAVRQAVELEEGLVLHFDIVFGRRFGLTDYAHDPLMHVLGVPERLTVVSIHPSPAALQTQFESRQQQQRERRGSVRELWHRVVHRPMRESLRRVRGERRTDTSRIYAHPSELQQTYREWVTFAQSLVSRAHEGKLICVEPVTGRENGLNFALIADPPAALSRPSLRASREPACQLADLTANSAASTVQK
jgi:energy-coupling factor transporter ATP-binding protein EcfA2